STIRCQSVSSRHSPDCWSFTLRFVASEKLVTEVPEGVNLVSASLPKCPSRITLLTLLPAMVIRTLTHCATLEIAYWGCTTSEISRGGQRFNSSSASSLGK